MIGYRSSAMLTRYKGKTALKSWGQKIAKRCHSKGASPPRKLAVVMLAMLRDGTFYADRLHADDASIAAPTGQVSQASGCPRMTLAGPFNRKLARDLSA